MLVLETDWLIVATANRSKQKSAKYV